MTHNEKRSHWLKEGAVGLGGKFINVIFFSLCSFSEEIKKVLLGKFAFYYMNYPSSFDG